MKIVVLLKDGRSFDVSAFDAEGAVAFLRAQGVTHDDIQETRHYVSAQSMSQHRRLTQQGAPDPARRRE